jgi:hypothetical protein
MSERTRRLMLAVAMSHLILVALGAGGLSPRLPEPLGQLLNAYEHLSGTATSYGFFAPSVSGQNRARFDVIDGEGHTTTTSLETARSREADLRVGDIIDRFGGVDDPDVRRSLAASFAGKIFARYPHAHAVVVRLESFEPVSMEEFRRGVRPDWTPLYEAKFVHPKGQKPKEGSDETSLR